MQSINNQFLVFQNDQTCYIIVSYLEEKQKPFLVQSIEKEKKLIYPTKCIFWHWSSHKCQQPEILNTLRLVYF